MILLPRWSGAAVLLWRASNSYALFLLMSTRTVLFNQRSMKRPSFKLILSLTLVAVFFILVNRYFLHDAVNELAASLIKKPAVALFRQFNKARSFTDVLKNYSRINFVTDPMFRVAAKARGSKTQGIANGASQDGLYLNLVTNAEEIKEGDIIVTNGSDIFPAALIIGTVEHIEINESRIFKKIRVKPAADGYSLGKVIVIKNNAHQ